MIALYVLIGVLAFVTALLWWGVLTLPPVDPLVDIMNHPSVRPITRSDLKQDWLATAMFGVTASSAYCGISSLTAAFAPGTRWVVEDP